MGLILWPLYFVKIGKGLGKGPDNRLEDAVDGFTQIIGGSSNLLLTSSILYMVFSALYNACRISVTQRIGATTSAVLDNVRIVIVWAFFLVPFGEYLCRVQGSFHFTAPIGLAILMVGILLYNDMVIMPTARKLFRRRTVSLE